MYTSKDAAGKGAEWLDELSQSTPAELHARYLDLVERYDQLVEKLHNRNTWLFILGTVLAMFVTACWLGMPLSSPVRQLTALAN